MSCARVCPEARIPARDRILSCRRPAPWWVTLDSLDLRLLHALQLDGRAPFSRIAEVLNVRDRTVARRYERLRAAGAVRVAAVTDRRRTGHAEWLIRLRVLPGGAAAIAHALARRPDTAWVTVASSGTEIVCTFRTNDRGPAPLEALARHPQILKVDAHWLLRDLMDSRWLARTSALTAEEICALRSPGPGDATQIRLTDFDRRLLPALAMDGRATYPALAQQTGWSESAIRRRLEELRRSGLLQFDVETDPELFGFSVQCLLWLTIAPSRLATVAQTLAADPEAAFVGATTGTHNLLAIAICRDTDALYTYVTDRVGSLNGVERVETTPVTSYIKRAAPTFS
ncbi:AsnC family transcriptional regulator [Streptomyces sp. NPDC002187]|uniref:AsnC family transcriptional regulator n=1 Tax=Streptomyces sp. NPDC002187 TaxID=3364637 RepID=UPI00368E01E3